MSSTNRTSDNRISRRRMLGASAAAATTLMFASTSRVFGANEEVRMAVVGTGSRGNSHIGQFSKMSGSRITALCDADERVLGGRADGLAKREIKVQTFTDIRKLLDS